MCVRYDVSSRRLWSNAPPWKCNLLKVLLIYTHTNIYIYTIKYNSTTTMWKKWVLFVIHICSLRQNACLCAARKDTLFISLCWHQKTSRRLWILKCPSKVHKAYYSIINSHITVYLECININRCIRYKKFLVLFQYGSLYEYRKIQKIYHHDIYYWSISTM